MAHLVIVRHGQSEWNELGLWTGWQDVGLTEKGKTEAAAAGGQVQDIPLHKAYTSKLKRAQQTLEHVKQATGHEDLETIEHEALNERHYGEYTGKNKWEIKANIGDDEFQKLRRNWDHPVPGGETLKDVHARVVPYFEANIIEDLKAGRNVIIAAHGNSIRALMKHLEAVEDHRVHELEIGTGEILVYEFSPEGNVVNKQVRGVGGKA